MSNIAPSRADPVVVFPLSRWCPPQETSPNPLDQMKHMHPEHISIESFTMMDLLWFEHGQVITYPVQCGIKILIHSKTSRLHCWSLVMDKKFHLTFCNGCNYLRMPILKLIHVKVAANMKKFWNSNNIRIWFVSIETNTHIQCRKYVWIMSPIMNWNETCNVISSHSSSILQGSILKLMLAYEIKQLHTHPQYKHKYN